MKFEFSPFLPPPLTLRRLRDVATLPPADSPLFLGRKKKRKGKGGQVITNYGEERGENMGKTGMPPKLNLEISLNSRGAQERKEWEKVLYSGSGKRGEENDRERGNCHRPSRAS